MPNRTLLLLFLLMMFCVGPARAETGVIEIYTIPDGQNVYLNGIFVGHTPYTDPDIPIGEHSISVTSLDGTMSQNWSFVVDELTPLIKWFYFEDPQPAQFSGTLEQPSVDRGYGNVQFASIPSGATIFVNGQQLTQTPASYLDVAIGSYQVEFKLAGKTLSGSFRVEDGETGKLIADFAENKLIDKWRKEKSKTERMQSAAEEKAERQTEEEHERITRERLKVYSAEERRQILNARDTVFTIVPVEYMYKTNRTYYYNSMKLDPKLVRFYKLPYDKVTLEIKNLKARESQLIGTYFEGDYVFRYGKHIRRGKLNSSDLSTSKFKLYNDIVIKLRYDPDSSGYGKGEGRVFMSIR